MLGVAGSIMTCRCLTGGKRCLPPCIVVRSATRAQLKTAADPATRAVLDARQRALKITANALYGFTGAGASQLQCVPLADSCLAYGAQSCRQERGVLGRAFS